MKLIESAWLNDSLPIEPCVCAGRWSHHAHLWFNIIIRFQVNHHDFLLFFLILSFPMWTQLTINYLIMEFNYE